VSLGDLKKRVRVTVQRAASLFVPPRPVLTTHELLSAPQARSVIDQFHTLWYSAEAASTVRWMGQPILKNPLDLWMYQDIIVERKPDVIIETGTHRGGSALFFSSIAQIAGLSTTIITIDINPKIEYDTLQHGITSVVGISTTDATVDRVHALLADTETKIGRAPRTMIVLDSDHSEENVREELRLYAPLVSGGQFLVVEDTNVNGHPVNAEHGPGPREAVDAFLAQHPEFERDENCERFLLTFNPHGWLHRRP
jgi:cephalosporin hydroxylase